MDPVFDPHHRFGHGSAPDPQRRFDDARWAANVNQLVRMLAHQRTTLVPFDDVRSRLESAPVIPRGTQIIPLDSVVGSVERYHDFTGEFLPRNEELRARWQRLDQATQRMETIPPIDVYKLGDLYFVRDGNHRVSVARFNRLAHIEANVMEIPVKVALTPDMNVNQIILGAERSDFLSRTRLDELRPAAEIEFTAPGRYQEALEHIDLHRRSLGAERNAEVPSSEVVVSWYDNVYLPAVEAIRRSGLLANFPNRTAADLYLWTMGHLAELQAAYSTWVDTGMAASDLAREHTGNRVKQAARAVKKKIQALLGHDEVPPIVEALLDKLEEQERKQMMALSTPAATRLSDLSTFTYGTTRLGDESLPFTERVKTARAAMDAGVWFHTSHTYGDTFRVLRAAFDEDRAHVPPAIFKIGWDSISQIRDVIRQNLEPLGLERMAIGQLCLGQQLAAEFRTGGPCYEGFRQLQEEGLVGRYVLEVWPWNSDAALDALRAGYPEGVVDGYIFYFNPLQRFASNELFDLIRERNQPIIAMRTVGGGPVHRQRDVPGAAPDYLRARAEQVAPLFERSGCQTWTEFCVRYVFGYPQVRTTVGSTSRQENLQEFLDAAGSLAPLPDDIQTAVEALQRSWADEHDRHAQPWSM